MANKGCLICGKTDVDLVCTECRSCDTCENIVKSNNNHLIKKTTKKMLDNEIKFLEKHLKYIRNARKEIAGLQPYQYPIEQRLRILKEKLLKLEEK
jgi:methylphosphotriester-DNA--protein-cysteine methyltransferase